MTRSSAISSLVRPAATNAITSRWRCQIGQRCRRNECFSRLRSERGNQFSSDSRRQQCFALRDNPERLQQLRWLTVLEQKSAGSGTNYLEHVVVHFERG